MSMHVLRRMVSGEIFDYQVLVDCLGDVKYPRAKIGRLLKNGEIIRIKKGLYIFGDTWRKNEVSLEVAANLIYGPSCISFEYALFRYGMIAERAVAVTSLTIGRAKRFDTPIGVFEYSSTNKRKFGVGIEYREFPGEGGFFIASKEKALVDTVSRIRISLSLKDFKFYLIEELRIDENSLRSLDKVKLKAIHLVYQNSFTEKLLQL